MSKTNAEKSPDKMLRILMLHGYTQNAALFKDRTGGVRKSLKQLAELVYCDAPFDVPKFTQTATEAAPPSSEKPEQPQHVSDETETASKGWYTKRPDSDQVQDVEQSLDYLNQIFKDLGPFDGVWGFSQGATMTHFLVNALLENHRNQPKSDAIDNRPPAVRESIKFKFAILTATSKSAHAYWPGFDRFYRQGEKLTMPSLHIIGKSDKITDFEKSLELAEYYENPRVYVHEQGHFIPGDKESKLVYSQFLQEMMQKKF